MRYVLIRTDVGMSSVPLTLFRQLPITGALTKAEVLASAAVV
jgi:hypothetical protein